MSKQFRPLLAGTITTFENLTYPVYASKKLDGIRCIVKDGKVLSRSLKEIPNKYVKSILSKLTYPQLKTKEKIQGYDGELLLKNNKATFTEITSAIMSEDGEPDFIYSIFDIITDEIYEDRLSTIEALLNKNNKEHHKLPKEVIPFLQIVEQDKIKDHLSLSKLENKLVKEGYEGIMVRSPVGIYKYGRSTENEEYLLKYKRFAQDEAIVVGFKEKMINNNPKEKSELGLSKRSQKKELLEPSGTLGALKVIMQQTDRNIDFEIGTGFDDELRQEIWDNQDSYINKIVTFKHQSVGADQRPRFPVFVGFRDIEDL